MASKNYKVDKRLEVFYTGGAVRVSDDGAQLACACSDEVKVPSCGMQNIDALHLENPTCMARCWAQSPLLPLSSQLVDANTGVVLRAFPGVSTGSL
jgi:hypothetical protein